jgi:transposase
MPSGCSAPIRTTESGGPRGFDPAKKGRKRHMVTDTSGLLLALLVHPANVQDNHGAVPLLTALGRKFPQLRHIFADRVYRGEKLVNALADLGKWRIEIVTRSQSLGTLKGRAQTLGDRAQLRLVRAQSPLSKRLRGHHRQRRSMDHDRQHSPARAPSRKSLKTSILILSQTLRRRRAVLAGRSPPSVWCFHSLGIVAWRAHCLCSDCCKRQQFVRVRPTNRGTRRMLPV